MKAKLSGRLRLAGIGAAMAAVVGLSGCGLNVQQIPLPGGVDVGSDPRTYKIEFENILDLVPQSMVKLDGVNVGRVTKIEVPQNSWNAVVSVKVRNSVDLSNEAKAAVQQTNLLGEKFVALTDPGADKNLPPQSASQPIPVSRTKTTTDIEQLLGALSMLLNGGGINQLEPIVTSINEAFGTGNQPENVRSLLQQSEKLISGLNEQRDNIIRAVDGVSALSARANAQTAQIERILNQLPAGVKVLEDQRPEFVDLLTKLDKLGQVGTDVLGTARQAIINDLKALRPILTQLAKAAPDAITASPLMLTHPFPDDLLPGVHGDSSNLFLTVDLRLLNQLEALGVGQGTPKYQAPGEFAPKINARNPYTNGNGPRYGWPTISLLPPGQNWKPGPNTPPSGGTYPMNPTASRSNPKKPSSTTKKKKQDDAQYSMMPTASEGQGFMDATIAMMGDDDGQ